MTTLLDAPSQSPRAAWLSAHNLAVRDYQNRHTGGWDHHSLNTDRYLCANRAMTRYASGANPEQAEARFAERYNIPWWKLDGFECAPAVPVVREALPVLAGEQLVMAVPPTVEDWE
jgi:hypothetical protein